MLIPLFGDLRVPPFLPHLWFLYWYWSLPYSITFSCQVLRYLSHFLFNGWRSDVETASQFQLAASQIGLPRGLAGIGSTLLLTCRSPRRPWPAWTRSTYRSRWHGNHRYRARWHSRPPPRWSRSPCWLPARRARCGWRAGCCQVPSPPGGVFVQCSRWRYRPSTPTDAACGQPFACEHDCAAPVGEKSVERVRQEGARKREGERVVAIVY